MRYHRPRALLVEVGPEQRGKFIAGNRSRR